MTPRYNCFLFILMLISGFSVSQTVMKIPAFSYVDTKGIIFSDKNIKGEGMILYFNPLCDICRDEMKYILKNIEFFKTKQIVLISSSDLKDIQKFVEDFNLKSYKNFRILHDNEDTFHNKLNAKGYPSLYIFNNKKQIIASFEGETKFNIIKESFASMKDKKKKNKE